MTTVSYTHLDVYKRQVLTLTAMLSAGAAVSVWAAAGWVQNNGQWQYQDRDGYIVRNEWQKGADGKYRYLDSSGYIAVSTWIDDEYYVGSDGIMVTDSWLREDCSSETDSGIAWYYFDSRGQAEMCIRDRRSRGHTGRMGKRRHSLPVR